MEPCPERRMYPRLKTCIRVECVYAIGPQWSQVREDSVTTTNISPAGLCFRYHSRIPAGTVLRLRFLEPASQEYVDGFGRVVWCSEEKEACGWRIGVEFMAVSQKQDEKDYSAKAENWLKTYCEA